jgi:hypothetical protein
MTAGNAYMRAVNRIRIVVNRSSVERYRRRPDDRRLSHGLNQDGDVGGFGQPETVAPPKIVPIVDVEREGENIAASGQLPNVCLGGWTRAAAFGRKQLDHRGPRLGVDCRNQKIQQ